MCTSTLCSNTHTIACFFPVHRKQFPVIKDLNIEGMTNLGVHMLFAITQCQDISSFCLVAKFTKIRREKNCDNLDCSLLLVKIEHFWIFCAIVKVFSFHLTTVIVFRRRDIRWAFVQCTGSHWCKHLLLLQLFISPNRRAYIFMIFLYTDYDITTRKKLFQKAENKIETLNW